MRTLSSLLEEPVGQTSARETSVKSFLTQHGFSQLLNLKFHWEQREGFNVDFGP